MGGVRLQCLGGGVLVVVVDDHRQYGPAGGGGAGLYGGHGARHRGVDGGAQAFGIADLLAQLHWLSRLDQRGTGLADVLNHWDDDLAWKGGGGGRAAGELLAAGGMYAAPEQMSHAFTSFLKSGAEIGGKTGAEYLAAGGVHPWPRPRSGPEGPAPSAWGG